MIHCDEKSCEIGGQLMEVMTQFAIVANRILAPINDKVFRAGIVEIMHECIEFAASGKIEEYEARTNYEKKEKEGYVPEDAADYIKSILGGGTDD